MYLHPSLHWDVQYIWLNGLEWYFGLGLEEQVQFMCYYCNTRPSIFQEKCILCHIRPRRQNWWHQGNGTVRHKCLNLGYTIWNNLFNLLYFWSAHRGFMTYNHRLFIIMRGRRYQFVASGMILSLITCRAKLLKCDWLMRRAFFLNSGQKLLDPDWLRCFILSIRTKYQKYTQ